MKTSANLLDDLGGERPSRFLRPLVSSPFSAGSGLSRLHRSQGRTRTTPAAAGMPLPTAASSPPARTGRLAAPRRQAVTDLGNEPPLAATSAIAPSFDIVRVEPNGDSVIAGRAAPGATVELLRDGEPHFRAVADESGRFVVVPSPLPPGSHTIVLQSVALDGTRARSRDSVTVAIADNKTTPPLVALSTPDKPTMVLSNPDRFGAVPKLPETRATEGLGRRELPALRSRRRRRSPRRRGRGPRCASPPLMPRTAAACSCPDRRRRAQPCGCISTRR